MRICRKPPILSVVSQTRSIVAGGTAAVLLLGVGRWILFADPSRTSGALGGPLIVTSATTTDSPPPASPAATDNSTPEGTAVAALPARPVARPAASAAPSAPPSGDVGTPATTVAAPTSSGDHKAAARPHPGGQSPGDPATSSPGSGQAFASTADPTAPGTPTSGVDAARWWLTVSPGRWGGARSATAAGRSGTLEPILVAIPTPGPGDTTRPHG